MSKAPGSRPGTAQGKNSAKGTSSTREVHANPNLIVTRGLQEILDKECGKKGMNANGMRRKTFPLGKPPKTILCYLCGKGFGTTSISFHRPQCYLKQMIAYERGELRSCPVDPETHERQMQEKMDARRLLSNDSEAVGEGGKKNAGMNSMVGKGMESYSDNDWEMYNAIQQVSAFSACPNCGRTFLPDRLEVHLRSCRPGNTSKPVRPKVASSALPAEGEGAARGRTSVTRGGPGKQISASTTATSAATTTGNKGVASANRSPLPRESAASAVVPPRNKFGAKRGGKGGNSFPEVEMVESKKKNPEEEIHIISVEMEEMPLSAASPTQKPVKGRNVESTTASAKSPSEERSIVVAYESGEVRNNVMVVHSVQLFPDRPEEIDLSKPLPPVHSSDKSFRGILGESTNATPNASITIDEKRTSARPPSRPSGSQHLSPASCPPTSSSTTTPTSKETTSLPPKISELVPCAHCHRTFLPSRIQKHETVCTERPAAAGGPSAHLSANAEPPEASSFVSSTVGASLGSQTLNSTYDERNGGKMTVNTVQSSVSSGGSPLLGGRVRANKSLILKRKAAADKTVMYCGDCGSKLLHTGQVFCNACGMKTQDI